MCNVAKRIEVFVVTISDRTYDNIKAFSVSDWTPIKLVGQEIREHVVLLPQDDSRQVVRNILVSQKL